MPALAGPAPPGIGAQDHPTEQPLKGFLLMAAGALL